jgi:hypothetical protein
MRKVCLLALLAFLVPWGLFPEAGFGVAAFYQSPVLIGQDVDTNDIGLEDFTFGGNLRFKLSLLQLDGLALVTLGDNPAIDAFLDGELALDIAILRISAGLGPNLTYTFDDGEVSTGFNAKANLDFLLGPVSVGLSYIMALDVEDGISLDRGTGFLGATFLLW